MALVAEVKRLAQTVGEDKLLQLGLFRRLRGIQLGGVVDIEAHRTTKAHGLVCPIR